MRKKHRIGKLILGVCCVLIALMALGTLDAYREIRKARSGAIWHLPSRIYSRPCDIVAGTDLERIDLNGRLERLRYRAADRAASPGEYHREADCLLIHLRPFAYPDGEEEARVVRLELDGGTVRAVLDDESGMSLSSCRLEPECIAEIFDRSREDRTIVTIDECPQALIDAVIATEDRRFYQHRGIDLRSILRAGLVNIKHRRIVEGASTITQQLIKNLYLSPQRTFTRKIRETWMALLMEIVYSKDEILEMYLNEIYMGQWDYAGVYGMGRASRIFFDKPVSALTVPEAALLAGTIRAPNRYSPYTAPARALGRRNMVLTLMQDQGNIDGETCQEARESALDVVPFHPQKRQAPYFVDYLLSSLQDEYPASLLSRGGYSIFTTLDMQVQALAAHRLQHTLKNLERSPRPELQGAVVIVDPRDGALLAMVGGRDYGTSQYNRAVSIKRHIGSLVKPTVYYTALRGGATLSDFIDDSAISVPTAEGDQWKPENFGHKSHGRVMLREALSRSYNQATVRLGTGIGLEKVRGTLCPLLPDVQVPSHPSVLLGAVDCSPLQVARMYTAFADKGVAHDPWALCAVVNEKGTVVRTESPSPPRQVLDPAVVFVVDDALGEVVRHGTARGSRAYGMPDGVCGKTGTTNDLRDSWFVGFTPQYVVCVWLGNDDFEPVGLTGSSGAMPVAAMILSGLSDDVQWAVPRDVVYRNVSHLDGKLVPRWNKEKLELPYISGTEPSELSEETVPKVFRSLRKWFRRDGR